MSMKRFINPYTFVTLGDECDKSINLKTVKESHNERLSGYIDCSLETLTELFIPDTSKEPDELSGGHKRQEFNKVDNKPVIPGSSIRGVIRSVFETITNSCLSTTRDDSYLHKRYPDPGVPGVLGREGKNIILYQNANKNLTRISLKRVQDYDDLIQVTHEKKGEVRPNPKGDHILFKGEHNFGKKKAGIFKKGKPIRVLDEKELKRFEAMLDLYAESAGRTQNKRNRHSGYKKYRRLYHELKRGGDRLLPVYYKEINGVYYLSPAAITKEVFNHTVKDLLAKNGEYDPCDDIEHLCPACHLFGTTNLKKNDITSAIGSRVRFTDAQVATTGPYFLPYKILKELASPKTSAIEFYMFEPELAERYEGYNYDYLFNWDKNHKKQAKYALNVPFRAKIRGRKYYWHHLNFNLDDVTEAETERNNRNLTVELLKRNQRFTFRVYFDQVTKDELTRLLWSLDFDNVNLDENSYFKHKRAHKIGMGKPLGLGSVEIQVNNIVIRKLSIENHTIQYRLESLDRASFPALKLGVESPVYIRELFEIMSYYDESANDTMAQRRKGIPVRYPFVVPVKGYQPKSLNETANHQWFNLNRGDSVKEVINKTLPVVGFTSEEDREDLSLEAYEVKPKEKKSNRNKQQSFQKKRRSKQSRNNHFFQADNPFKVLEKLKKK